MQTKNKRSIFIWALLAAMALGLGGCSTPALKVESIPKSENPQELINTLEGDIAMARKDQINVLSPTWFGDAEASLNSAKAYLDDGDALSKILDSVALGRARLQKATEIAKVTKLTIPDAIKARDLARSAGATSLGRDYSSVEDRFLELSRAVERENLGYAQKSQERVAEAYRQLELRAIKDQTIGEVRRLIEDAEAKKLPRIAPKSYAEAKQKLAEADAFITENPYAKEKMHDLANQALFMAHRLHVVADRSLQIKQMEPEQITLWAEGLLYATSSKLGAPDMRDRSFDQQLENILASVAAQQSDHAFMVEKVKTQQADIALLQKQIAALEGKTLQEQEVKERLMAEKRFNQLFSEVKGYFQPEEAEVYRQENQLIVRLKAMQFPVGQSVILPENYTLLTKVQQAIRTFGEPEVIIGGHTDSTGSEQLNEHLSQQRAEAVREYMVANAVLPFEKIIAVGYGSQRPIASNATESGRALNRRIDVTITPEPSAIK
jgi:outer membrane protein OmpA-like peptidoglycan-associated protein